MACCGSNLTEHIAQVLLEKLRHKAGMGEGVHYGDLTSTHGESWASSLQTCFCLSGWSLNSVASSWEGRMDGKCEKEKAAVWLTMWEPCAMELGTQHPALGEVTTCIQLTEAPEAAGHMHGSCIRSHLGLSCGICWENSETQSSSSVLLTECELPHQGLFSSVSFHTLLPSCFLEC